MRKAIIFLLLPLLVSLTSCREVGSADTVLRNFCASYGLSSGTMYSSEEKMTSPSYLDEKKFSTLYGGGERPLYHSVAVMLYADMDGICECGVFVCRGGAGKLDDVIATEEMLASRLYQIRKIFPEAEGVILRYGRIVVYTVLPDNARAERLFSRIL